LGKKKRGGKKRGKKGEGKVESEGFPPLGRGTMQLIESSGGKKGEGGKKKGGPDGCNGSAMSGVVSSQHEERRKERHSERGFPLAH